MEHCCFGLPLVGMLGLAAVVLIARQQNRLTLRWWALPVFLFLSMASLRFGFIMVVCGPIAGWAMGGGRPAFWLRELWVSHSWPLLLLGPIGLVLVLAFKGVRLRNRARDATRKAIVVAVLIMCMGAALALDTFFFWCAYSGFGGKPQQVAQAVRPDRRVRIRAFGSAWLGACWFTLESEANTPHPIWAYTLVEGPFDHSRPLLPGDSTHLVWSKDSKVVALWFEDTPIVGYDFARRVGLCQGPGTWFDDARGRQEYRNSDELKRGLMELMRQHGDAALDSE